MGAVFLATAAFVAADDGAEQSGSSATAQGPSEVVALSQAAADGLASGDVSREIVDRQQAIVELLSKLLSGAETTVDSSPQGVASQRPVTSPSGKGAQGGTSQGPGSDGAGAESSGLAPAEEGEVLGDLKRREGLADAVWGHLPPKVRDELYRSYTETYVPQYDQLLRRYFEALAESASLRGKEGRRE